MSANPNLLARALREATWAIGSCDGSTLIEVRRLESDTLYIVVECQTDGTVKRVDSKRGMQFERAKARAIYLAGCT